MSDADLTALLRLAGPTLFSLALKGCASLGCDAAEALCKYTSKTLQYLSLWERITDVSLARLLTQIQTLSYLDASGCVAINARVFEAMRSLLYLNLSELPDAFDKKAFKSWLNRCGSSLSCLVMVPPKVLAESLLEHYDDDICSALAAYCPELMLLDLSNCRHVTSKGIRSLANLNSLRFVRLAGVTDTIDSPSLLKLFDANPDLHQMELRRRGTSDIAVCFPPQPMNSSDLSLKLVG